MSVVDLYLTVAESIGQLINASLRIALFMDIKLFQIIHQ